MTRSILKSASLNAAATAAYVIAIGSLLFYAPQVFGRAKSPLIPIAMLLLLVFSAALTGSLMLGKAALWYLDGKKKEALSLLVNTLSIFLAITLLAFLALYFARTW